MTENSFKTQIEEDIALIQEQFGYLDPNLQKPEYAFNYWILSRLYCLDEETLLDNITDYSDKGVDCWVHYEDTKELFLIQNKYYSETNPVSSKEVSDFLTRPLATLLNNSYTRSEDLQKIFNKAISDSEYKIWLHFYVANNRKSADIDNLINNFKYDKGIDDRIEAGIYARFSTLEDIRNIYFDDRFTEKRQFSATLTTRTKGSSLDILPNNYGLQWMLKSSYILVNVVELYHMLQEAKKPDVNYQLFEENIREFLGTSGRVATINNGIIKTLEDSSDRENFFYYNNGITIICEDMKKSSVPAIDPKHQNLYKFELKNPQIVNGCQTINSIAYVLDRCKKSELDKQFSKTFVLVKVFVFDEEARQNHPELGKAIVKYTNSQNAIREIDFAAKQNYFLNIQKEFEKRGLLLLVKPSDQNKFENEYKSSKINELKAKSQSLFDFFAIKHGKKVTKSLEIELLKLLKALLAFFENGFIAYTKGSYVLKPNSTKYTDFSLKIADKLTIDNMIRLYFLYLKAETDQRKSADRQIPVPYYLLGFIGALFQDKTFDELNKKLTELFNDQDAFNDVYAFFSDMTTDYKFDTELDYNIMIKSPIKTKWCEDYFIKQQSKSGNNYPETVRHFIED